MMWAYVHPLPPRCAPFDQPKTHSGHSMRTSKAVQMTQNWVNVLIFGRLIFTPFHILKIKIKHIGFIVGLQGGLLPILYILVPCANFARIYFNARNIPFIEL